MGEDKGAGRACSSCPCIAAAAVAAVASAASVAAASAGAGPGAGADDATTRSPTFVSLVKTHRLALKNVVPPRIPGNERKQNEKVAQDDPPDPCHSPHLDRGG